MLDFTAIKTILLQIPTGGKPNGIVPARYARTVNKEMAKAELILKVILARQSGLVETYKTLIVDGSETDFQKIMDLKGIPRNEQKQLMETYTNNRGTTAGKSNIRKLLSDVQLEPLKNLFSKSESPKEDR